MLNLRNIASQFQIHQSQIFDITPFGNGHINNTYKVTVANDNTDYLLQKINHHIFKDVEMLQENIWRITNHIRAKLTATNEQDIDRKTLNLIPTIEGKLYYQDETGYWRMMILIPDSYTFEVVTPEYSYAAGKAFADFQRMLSDLPGEPLGETIPDFHNMEFRLKQFREAVQENKAGRASAVADLIEEIEKRADEMVLCQRLYREGKLPKRINHCDTKVNNMLFDSDGNVLCVIDLDTTMPGFVVSDFGDFMRTAGNTGLEDDPDLDKVNFNMEIFEAYTRGYIEVAKSFLTPLEIELLPFGARLITCMQFLRFLSDYLNGDTYYKIHHPEHNLQRSRAQLKLLQSIEYYLPQMNAFIASMHH
jgi:thiamine kinase-like enzyme